MKLCYYNEERNFGDELNELIFNYYLPGFFDDREEELFLGIGTILGLEKPGAKTRKVIVFSSGFGSGDVKTYGEKPEINELYDIICVRGPLTANMLKLPPPSAITDGALLLKGLDLPKVEKKYAWSFMPHHISEKMFPDWKVMVEKAGGNYISPAGTDALNVIKLIRQSEILIAEAMHGAIVADIYRVPWIPVKAYEHINSFKWNDWLKTYKLDYKPVKIKSLFNEQLTASMILSKIPFKLLMPVRILTKIYQYYQQWFLVPGVIKRLKRIRYEKYYLSDEKLLNNYFIILKEKIEFVKKKYG